MDAPVNASAPKVNAAVRASAGTGKTWLLIARLVRLLLNDVPPQAILAITFTRKAAAEMQERVLTRLFELTACTDDELNQALDAMGVAADPRLRSKARALHEELLTGEPQINITTFHAFCQHVLHRFPLEADVPPGFEVAENTGLLEQAAWDALFAESTRAPDAPLGRSLEALFEYCGGLYGAQAVLGEFLQRRSDWLAYTQGIGDGPAYAADELSRQLDVDPDLNPAAALFTERTEALLREFLGLLLRHPTGTNRRHADLIEHALDAARPAERRLTSLEEAFLKRDGQPLARKASATLVKKLGEAGQARFLGLHGSVCSALERTHELQNRLSTFRLSKAWYEAGTRLLEHYQAIKDERRLLDFADLEWKAYRLLNRPDHMLWVQYKLDQSIEHILIDEFQDTNPTQWRLIHPLLEQLVEPQSERARSVFLVGDDKQSIYRFRRAEPRLFDTATEWLTARPDGRVFRLDTSYRSAQAIMDFVNRVFGGGPLADQLTGFAPHQTHRRDLWGRVEVLPAIEPADDTDAGPPPVGMRNALEQPRAQAGVSRHYEEGRRLAGRIQGLLDERTPVGAQDQARPLRLSDIVILVRDRTHAPDYELALRDAGIPYLGISRGSLLSSLEVMDMMALLNTLVAPYNDLALATVLRSPLFDCSDEDLMRLAVYPHEHGHHVATRAWFDRLVALGPQLEAGSPLQRACRWLQAWREAADRIPVHDLLDRIYCEADVMARYEAAFPAHLQGRIRANLTRFIELALEVDSGRYPSLSHFLAVLHNLQEQGREGPDEGSPPSLNAVRLMTVHAAKGLEAPVVFLADAAWTRQTPRSYHTMVAWPAEADRPRYFYLTGKRSQMDALSRHLHGADQQADQREEANLLYVALTRARQLLIVSGCRPSRERGRSWYDLIVAQIAPEGLQDAPWAHETGQRPGRATPPPTATAPAAPVDPRLGKPLASPGDAELAPSRAGQTPDAEGGAPGGGDGRLRGVAIHRMLEMLAAGTVPAAPSPPRRIAGELGVDVDAPDYLAWWREACSVYHSPALAQLFDPSGYVAAYNEVPLQYMDAGRWVHGVVDRLVVFSGEVTLIDYKTHSRAAPANLQELAAPYRETMRLYQSGVRRLWPDKRVSPRLLFTACATLYDVEGDP